LVVGVVGGFTVKELVRLTIGDVVGLDVGEIVESGCLDRWWIYSW
jgi:tRNA A37 threonylcarbamoyladenosine dehydratase